MSEVHIQSISNNNYEVIKKAIELLNKVANIDEDIQYYYNIRPEDILLIEFFEDEEGEEAVIYLRNGLVITASEEDGEIYVRRVE